MRRPRSLATVLVMVVASLPAVAVLGPTAAEATPPGPVGRIAFDEFFTGQIYAVNPDGTALTQLTHVDAKHQALSPSWTPDGTQVLYSETRLNFQHARIWIVNADGTGAHRIASDVTGFRDYEPTMTPDGRFIVFPRCEPGDGVCAIWRMRADGTHMRALTPYQHSPNETVDFDPVVSSDSRRIAFTRFSSDGYFSRIFVMRLDGSDPHPITAPRYEACGPDWAPDDNTLAFISRCSGLGSHVFTAEPSGDDVTQLTHERYPTGSYDETFAPDGEQIAFSSDRRYNDFCCVDLFVMNADGSHQHRVPLGDLAGVIAVSWGSAPLESGPPASSFTHIRRFPDPPRNPINDRWRGAWASRSA
jgi:Tol biopolymer transport system component